MVTHMAPLSVIGSARNFGYERLRVYHPVLAMAAE
jgi:hypothetical protein